LQLNKHRTEKEEVKQKVPGEVEGDDYTNKLFNQTDADKFIEVLKEKPFLL